MTRRLLVALSLLFMIGIAQAQEDYPKRPIRIVLPFAAGGGTDVVARILAQKVSQQIGVAVMIENKGGANGNIGAELVAKAPADGYTLLYNTSFIVTNPVLYSSLSYDPVRDFSPVILIAKVPLILVAHPSVPANSAAEFVAYARSNPGKLNYASSGTGGSTHLATLLFLKASGISATHIPYRGGGPALIDLIAGNVQFYSDTANTALPYIQDNRLKALAVTASQRIRDLPETPTVAETIKAEFDVVSWQGLMAPAGTPRPIIERLNPEFRKAMQDPDIVAKLSAQAAIPVGTTIEEYKSYLRKEAALWKKTIEDANIKVE